MKKLPFVAIYRLLGIIKTSYTELKKLPVVLFIFEEVKGQ